MLHRCQGLPLSSVIGGESFRLEIGNISISDRRGAAASEETRGRSYFVGVFKYLIHEEAVAEVEFEFAFGYAVQRSVSGEKHDSATVEAATDFMLSLAVGRGGSSNSSGWLKDYVDRLSNTMSF